MSRPRTIKTLINTQFIAPWSLVAAGRGLVDTPLRRRSCLAVGYGNGGANPLYFGFAEGETQEIGFFKLFITSSPATLQCISQEESPFVMDTERDEEAEISRAEAEEQEMEKVYADRWGVKTITLLQLKA